MTILRASSALYLEQSYVKQSSQSMSTHASQIVYKHCIPVAAVHLMPLNAVSNNRLAYQTKKEIVEKRFFSE